MRLPTTFDARRGRKKPIRTWIGQRIQRRVTDTIRTTIVARIHQTSWNLILWIVGPGASVLGALLTWWLTMHVRRRNRRAAATGKPNGPDSSDVV